MDRRPSKLGQDPALRGAAWLHKKSPRALRTPSKAWVLGWEWIGDGMEWGGLIRWAGLCWAERGGMACEGRGGEVKGAGIGAGVRCDAVGREAWGAGGVGARLGWVGLGGGCGDGREGVLEGEVASTGWMGGWCFDRRWLAWA